MKNWAICIRKGMYWYDWISVPVICASVFTFIHHITLASMTNWIAIHEYNSVGEGPLELFIAWASIPFICMTIWDIIKIKEDN